MPKKPRPRPNYQLERYNHDTCRCGCLRPVHGKKIYDSAACRKRMQRLLDRLERTKVKKPDEISS